MMIAQPRQQQQQQQSQHHQEPHVRSYTTRGRSMSRRLPPFLVVAAGASSSSSEGSAEGARNDPQQRPKSRQRRRSNHNHSRSQQRQHGGQASTSSGAAPTTTRILRRLSHSLRRHRRGGSRPSSSARRGAPSATTTTTRSSDPNVLDFLQASCPREVLPLVLAYAGPQVAQALSHSNRFWNALLKDEATWKVQCQELYKWNARDEEPASWKHLYASSPCVPIDYPTIDRALAAVPHPVTLWLRPGRECVLQRPITVTTDMKIRVMTVPVVPCYTGGRRQGGASRSSSASSKVLPATDPADGVDETWRSSDDSGDEDEWPAPTRNRPDVSEQAVSGSGRATVAARSAASYTKRADLYADAVRPCTLVLHTRQMNAPAIWVQAGCLTLEHVVLSHACLGVDIWNGNAALQVQPPAAPAAGASSMSRHAPAPPLPLPRAVLTNCQVTSQSGRGIVVMDGGRVTIQQSCVANCAATGVYIGGPHSPPAADDAATPSDRRRSRADLLDSHVSGNGIGSYYRDALAAAASVGGGRGLLRGNRLPRRPSVIARGHSGVYLEQGDCHIASSVIRSNALTGISAVSDQARLVVTGSTLDSNGSQQLETVPSRFVRLENNRIVDLPPFPRHAAPALHRPGPPMPWVPNQRRDAEDMDEFVRMVMDQP